VKVILESKISILEVIGRMEDGGIIVDYNGHKQPIYHGVVGVIDDDFDIVGKKVEIEHLKEDSKDGKMIFPVCRGLARGNFMSKVFKIDEYTSVKFDDNNVVLKQYDIVNDENVTIHLIRKQFEHIENLLKNEFINGKSDHTNIRTTFEYYERKD
jgi:hypothetical protein